jgi:hypothetical protein
MTINPQDAADALATVEHAAARAQQARCYESASAPLIIWGVVWMVANGLCELWPERPGLIWLSADAVGAAATFVAVASSQSRRRETLRYFIAFAVMGVFVVSAFLIMPSTDGRQITGFIALATAFVLASAGVWRHGARLVALGLVLMAAIVAGHLLLEDYRYLWFGFAGGGSLVLAGLWMRKA